MECSRLEYMVRAYNMKAGFVLHARMVLILEVFTLFVYPADFYDNLKAGSLLTGCLLP